MDKVREVMEMSGVREGDIKQKRVSFISVCLHHFTIDQRVRYDLNCVKSAVKLQPTNQLINEWNWACDNTVPHYVK